MGQLQERIKDWQKAIENASQEMRWKRQITEILRRVEMAFESEDREEMNREISKLGRLLTRKHPATQVKAFLRALRHNTRFAWEENSNEPEIRVLDPDMAAKFGGMDNAWYWLSTRSHEALMMPYFLAHTMARSDRAANYLHTQYLGWHGSESYCDYCRFRIGRALLTLLCGDFSNGSYWGEYLLADLLSDVCNWPTREMAYGVVAAGIMNCDEAHTFRSKLYAELPEAEQAVERLLTLYNVLVRAETHQRHENAIAEARRHGLPAPHYEEPVLTPTEFERRLQHSPKGSKEAEFWLRVAAPFLFKCSPDNLCKVVNFPQKRGRLIVKEVLDVDSNANHARLLACSERHSNECRPNNPARPAMDGCKRAA